VITASISKKLAVCFEFFGFTNRGFNSMKNQIGYYSLSKAGRVNEDRFRLLGGGFLPQDQKCTGFQDSGRGEIYAVMEDYAGEPHLVAKKLVEIAKQRNVQDDITALMIEVI
jgi:hypothetical protein